MKPFFQNIEASEKFEVKVKVYASKTKLQLTLSYNKRKLLEAQQITEKSKRPEIGCFENKTKQQPTSVKLFLFCISKQLTWTLKLPSKSVIRSLFFLILFHSDVDYKHQSIQQFIMSHNLTLTACLLSLLVFEILSDSSALPPFAAYQFFLLPNGATLVQGVNQTDAYPCTLPIAYDSSYKRSLALAGFSFKNDHIDSFTATIYTTVDTIETIQIQLLSTLGYYQLSYYVLLVSTPQSFVWSFVHTFTPQYLNVISSSGPMSQDISLTLTGMSIANAADFIVCPLLVDFGIQTIHTGDRSEIQVFFTNITLPNILWLQLSRVSLPASKNIFSATVNTILINYISIRSQGIKSQTSYMFIYYKNANSSLLSDQLTNFGIQNSFLSTNQTNRLCVIGITRAKLYATYLNQIHFDARTTPFKGLIVNLQNNFTSPYNFFVNYTYLCLTDCPSIRYYNSTTGHCQCNYTQCLQCTIDDQCIQCNDTGTSLELNGSCIPCDQVFRNCSTCTNTYCLTCQSGFIARNGACMCLVGHYLQGLCNTIAGCVSPVILPNGVLSCLQCNSTSFVSDPQNGVCECFNGTLVNSLCNTIAGCIAPQVSANNQLVCQFCNHSSNFSPTPSSGLCQCSPNFKLVGDSCVEICGDGFLMVATADACDDGNVISGDGCSSTCAVQPYYQCYNGSSTSPSNCVYLGPALKISLQSITRNTSANQGFFSFKISPALSSLSKMDFNSLFSLKCDSAYSVTNVEYAGGVLKLVVDYTKNMQGVSCNLTLSYVQSLVKSLPSNLSFNAVSNDIKLLLSTHLELVSTAKFNFKMFALVVLGIFVFSLGHKMIGSELVVSCQTVYLSCSLFGEPTFVFNTITSLNAVNGMSYLFGESQFERLIDSFSQISQTIITQFLLNTTLVTGILESIMLVLALLSLKYCYVKCSQQSAVQQVEAKKQAEGKKQTNVSRKEQKISLQKRVLQLELSQKKARKAINFVYNSLLFPFVSAFFLVLQFSLYVGSFRLQSKNTNFILLDSIATITVLAICGLVFAVQFINVVSGRHNPNFIGFFKAVPSYYSLFFSIRTVFLAFCTIFLHSFSFSWLKMVALCPSFLYLLVLVLRRPYKRKLDNFGATLCQLTSCLGLLFNYIVQTFEIQEGLQILLVFLIQAMICISALMSFVRVLVFYFKEIKSCRKANSKPQKNLLDQALQSDIREQLNSTKLTNMVRINPFSLRELKRLKRGYSVQTAKEQLLQDQLSKDMIVKQQEDEQLKITKDRLRKQFLKNKKYNNSNN